MSLAAAFARIADLLPSLTAPGEFASLWFAGEDSEFVRFNHGRVRQAGRIERLDLKIRLVRRGCQAWHACVLPGAGASEAALRATLAQALSTLRTLLDASEPDALLLAPPEPVVASDDGPDGGIDAEALVQRTVQAAEGCDLVGFLASGPLARGVCTSHGTRLWFRRESYSLDFSIHLDEGRAVKRVVSSEHADPAPVVAAIGEARAQAEILRRPFVSLSPGAYRTLLSPRALADLLEMLAWGGFSARSLRAGHSPLVRMHAAGARLSPLLTIVEDYGAGFAPRFTADGLVRPPRIALVERGEAVSLLVSPRTGREFGLMHNAANDSEMPESLCVQPGALADGDALAALDTGLAIGNFWYLNFSDRQAARVTGMTRFATLWVEGGRIVGPVAPMRFDDGMFTVLGERLEALGAQAARLPALDTYDARQTSGVACPGALVRGLRFTS